MTNMKDVLLFINTYKSRRSNGVNKAYWTKYVNSQFHNLEIEMSLSKDHVDTFSEYMPIFSCVSKKQKRGLIIYQYNPSLVDTNEVSYSKYLTAWTSLRVIEKQRFNILTICLVSSSRNMETSKKLIKAWFLKQKVKDLINRIYESQDYPVKDEEK